MLRPSLLIVLVLLAAAACTAPGLTLCGDGTRDPGEVCDGTDLGGTTCQSLGYPGGQLRCLSSCGAFDVAPCRADARCGNQIRDNGEACDGTDFGGLTCVSLGLASGLLDCATDCHSIDTSGCGTCQPLCDGLACGRDPLCGEICGTCPNDTTCNAVGQCTASCQPDCSATECGPDPVCGESCGTCITGNCDAGRCVAACTPACGARVCGPDPVCGDSCGTCTSGVCNATGQCVASCSPNCSGRECGPDPVCGQSCGICLSGVCDGGQCVAGCTPNCDGRVCGPDPACGVSCGTCQTGVCGRAGQCVDTCLPDCAGRECGPDPTCGQSCGICLSGTCSANGVCVPDNPAERLLVQLIWDDPTNDQDLHLVNTALDSRVCNSAADCHWLARTPIWFSSYGPGQGPNPSMDIDDTNGLGPENISISTPASGTYRIFVHYYRGSTPTRETIKVFWDGTNIAQLSRTLSVERDLWAVADVVINPLGTRVVPYPSDESGEVGSIGSMATCANPGSDFTPTACTGPSDCPSGHCDTQLGECVECLVGTDCASGVCTAGHCTTANTCTTPADCGGQACFLNTCMPCFADLMCTYLADPPSSLICDTATGLCVAPECSTAVDCAAGQACYGGGHCGACAADGECRPGEVCNETSGVCGRP